MMIESSKSADLPYVSVVIPMYNAGSTLELCLRAVANLDYPADRYEVLLVDNGSTDSSIQIAERYPVRLLHECEHRSSYAARNKGIREARGELIAFTDADCVVAANWLKTIVREYGDRTVGCFAGEIETYFPQSLIENFSARHGILRQMATLRCPYLPYSQTANSVYRRDVFSNIGLFNPKMKSGGDADLAWRMQKQLGLRIKFIPEAIVFHKHRTSLMGLYRQFKKYEDGKLLWKKYYPDYRLPSRAERWAEVCRTWNEMRHSVRKDFRKYRKKQLDAVELASPLLRFVVAWGTYSARRRVG